MVKHTHTHTNNFTPAVEHCYILKSSHVSSCRHTHTVNRLEKHRSQSTDPEPFKRNVLFSVRDVLSSLVCFASSVSCWISSHLNVIGHHVAHSQFSALLIVLSLPACVYTCERLTRSGLCVCVCLYLDANTPSFPYVHFNLKSVLVAMETPTNVPLVGNNGLEYCTLYFIALQTYRQHSATL